MSDETVTATAAEVLRTIAEGGAKNPQKLAAEFLETSHEPFFVPGRGQILARFDSARPTLRWFCVGIDDANAKTGETEGILNRTLGLAFGAEDVVVEALSG